MSDWPHVEEDVDTVLSTIGPNSVLGDVVVNTGNAFNTSAVWPAANRAYYIPVWVSRQVTVYKMSFIVATQSGNYDVGIYDEGFTRLVSKTSTAVPVAGIAVVDITDTVLSPGNYFLAMCVDNGTASFRRSNVGTTVFRGAGVLEQAVGAVTLPDPMVGVGVTSAYAPYLSAHLRVTV